ncbi:MAG: helix-turn-helix transcriptional regulator [Spirochaetales bacterium]|nr:helix-turn-helix transcriptional regulator [Spirochaetales bacterium]
MRRRQSPAPDICPVVEGAFRLLGKKWTGLILHVLGAGEKRFSELLGALPRISARILSQRLAELEVEGLVARVVLPEIPVRVQYSLTEKGRSLSPILEGVAEWAHRWEGVKIR